DAEHEPGEKRNRHPPHRLQSSLARGLPSDLVLVLFELLGFRAGRNCRAWRAFVSQDDGCCGPPTRVFPTLGASKGVRPAVQRFGRRAVTSISIAMRGSTSPQTMAVAAGRARLKYSPKIGATRANNAASVM